MTQGNMLLSLWPADRNRRVGPAPSPGTQPVVGHPVLSVELVVGNERVEFPVPPRAAPTAPGDFSSLDLNTQHQLLELVGQDPLQNPPADLREVLWEKRHYLYHLPAALPKVHTFKP